MDRLSKLHDVVDFDYNGLFLRISYPKSITTQNDANRHILGKEVETNDAHFNTNTHTHKYKYVCIRKAK